MPNDVTHILRALADGNQAAADQLLPLTGLIHEADPRLVGAGVPFVETASTARRTVTWKRTK
jgi:hypothetical protein